MIILSIFSLTVLGGLLSGYATFVEPQRITVVPYDIVSPHLPEAFDGKRIAFITDIHHGTRWSCHLLDKIVAITQEQSPDLILLGGDYAREQPEPLAECFAKLSELDAPLGVYAVLGNHDWNLPLMRLTIGNTGITLLENQAVQIEEKGEHILLAGVTDFWTDRPSLAGMRQELAKSDFTILLSHNPDLYDTMSPEDRNRIDLMLSGHTHGGQVTLFGLYAPAKTADAKYLAGYLPADNGRTKIFVSNGIGTGGLPIRFFAPPQILLVTLKKER